MLNVCLVWTNDKYSDQYIDNMVSMIKRNMPEEVDYNIVLFTDKLEKCFDRGIDTDTQLRVHHPALYVRL